LSQALEIAWKVDSRIVIEEGLDVREIECGIIGNSQLLTSEIGEVNYESEWHCVTVPTNFICYFEDGHLLNRKKDIDKFLNRIVYSLDELNYSQQSKLIKRLL